MLWCLGWLVSSWCGCLCSQSLFCSRFSLRLKQPLLIWGTAHYKFIKLDWLCLLQIVKAPRFGLETLINLLFLFLLEQSQAASLFHHSILKDKTENMFNTSVNVWRHDLKSTFIALFGALWILYFYFGGSFMLIPFFSLLVMNTRFVSGGMCLLKCKWTLWILSTIFRTQDQCHVGAWQQALNL